MQAGILEIVKNKGIKKPMPGQVSPMLCSLIKEPIDDPDYLYEVKWDGYRIISYIQKTGVKLGSRSGLDYTKKYPPVAKALEALKINAVLDGEVIVLNDDGMPDFDALQKYNGHETPIYYNVFDIMWLEGYDLMHLPLMERKKILASLTGKNKIIKYSGHFDDGPALFKQVEKSGMEGIIAKHRESHYKPGERGRNWYKIPTEVRQEFVLGGWVESDRGRPFASLLIGAYNKEKQLEWIGVGGGGFKDAEMPVILKKLKSIEIKKSPFVNHVDTSGITHWAKPEIVANFKFATWTRSGRIRKPAIFLGIRKDKKAKDVVREIPVTGVRNSVEINDQLSSKKSIRKQIVSSPKLVGAKSNWEKIDKQKISNIQEFDIGGCGIEISNVGRELWKGITKADLIQYYHAIATHILPYLKNRPQSLLVKPINANAPGFYIKDMEGRQPDCAGIFTDQRKHKRKDKSDTIDYLVCNNEATLLYMINLGCIDVNPWTSRISSPNEPDYLVIDLDPGDNDFKKVIETARAAKEYFDKHKLKSFVKTSGKTGMHLLIPCRKLAFPQARSIAEVICLEINKLLTSITTTHMDISLRGNKLYLDPNQNDYADTIAAPYAVRPYHMPLVSTPLEWKEIDDNLHPSMFTMKNTTERINKKKDIFKELMNEKVAISNTKILKNF